MIETKLLQGVGIDRDFHQRGDRQISLLAADARLWMEAQTRKGLCFGRFRENMLIEGLSLEELECGIHISVGSAVLRIGVHNKRCYDECVLLPEGLPCRLVNSVCFAGVVQSGMVRIGDAVSVRSHL